ncbi:MAG TPA: M20/M25/M40 family metallo-hydrolase [Terriglobia bacterium]|nr:M20/M25/M40 family metallo-hydrolase [Terriglobia bacterium]
MNCMVWALLRPILAIFLLCTISLAEESVDLSVLHRIKSEAFEHSKVMDHLFQFTDIHGPRLTASPNYDEAASWAVHQLKEYGIESAHLEKWGPFGRRWSYGRFHIDILEPNYAPLIGFPLAWSAGTDGPVKAEPVLTLLKIERRMDPEKLRAEIEKYKMNYKGQLKGKMVLLERARDLGLQVNPSSARLSDGDLNAMFLAPEPRVSRQFDYSKMAIPEDPEDREQFFAQAPLQFWELYSNKHRDVMEQLYAFLQGEGAVAILSMDSRGDGGTVFGEYVGSWDAKYPLALPDVRLTPEHYSRIARLIERKVPVTLQLDLEVKASDENVEAANIVAEIPGTTRSDEIIMLGAHFDSWIGGTGATDNGVGSAVVLEVMRILKALKFQMARTVRLALWSGEEQGLLGSKAYVKDHFGDPVTMQIKPAQAKVSAYFNLDNGSGKIRGVYLQGNDAARPLFEAWLAPFRDQGVTTISIRDTGGTDHQSFDALGIPGFQFIQDALEYGTRTHHSNMDVYDHTQAGDLMQAAAVMATVVYSAATRAEMVPRKPLPEPHPLKP